MKAIRKIKQIIKVAHPQQNTIKTSIPETPPPLKKSVHFDI